MKKPLSAVWVNVKGFNSLQENVVTKRLSYTSLTLSMLELLLHHQQ